ncbi:ORF-84 [Catopsilia pomona nucleopolyhedrovirus]|uniref:ORF-84 n=1 Tax=Catopsilia pomona nucleopolyhedrovirus TaxID=1850906 RepID=A0A172WZF8_9ABAC|nr:ORF-84 [Catopsilia pomona nucleopolyhedrovirus]ANF29732.1 ORF-84 [Catopsilia pomona nucleopolyhedrovirus]
MFKCLIGRFKKHKSKDEDGNGNKNEKNKRDVVLCPKCYFVFSADVSVSEYIEMHKKFNSQFADECSNNFIVTNSKRWNGCENCSALYYPLN